MAEIREEFVKEITNATMKFIPSRSGSALSFSGMDLTQDECATLTWLMMNGPMLKVEISRVEE